MDGPDIPGSTFEDYVRFRKSIYFDLNDENYLILRFNSESDSKDYVESNGSNNEENGSDTKLNEWAYGSNDQDGDSSSGSDSESDLDVELELELADLQLQLAYLELDS